MKNFLIKRVLKDIDKATLNELLVNYNCKRISTLKKRINKSTQGMDRFRLEDLIRKGGK